MGNVDQTAWVLIALLVGALIYTVPAVYYRKFHVDRLVLMALAGASVPSGVDLICCGFKPAHLVHLVTLDGSPFRQSVDVLIGDSHRIDLGIAGIVLIAVGLSELVIELARMKDAGQLPAHL